MNSIIIAALCCSGISFTVTITSIFEPLRDWIGKFHHKLDEWINCPWCFNHYVVLAYMLIVTEYTGLIDFVVFLFAIITLSGLIHYVLIRAYEPIARHMMERKFNNRLK